MSCSTTRGTAGKPTVSSNFGVLIATKSRSGVDFLIGSNWTGVSRWPVCFHLYTQLCFRWSLFCVKHSDTGKVWLDVTWLVLHYSAASLSLTDPKSFLLQYLYDTVRNDAWTWFLVWRSGLRGSGDCNTSSEVTVRFSSASQAVTDAEHFLYKVLVSAYTVSLARETQILSHCLKVSVESGGVQKAGFMNDWSVVLGKRYLTESRQIFINYCCVLSSWLFFMAKTSTAKKYELKQMNAVNTDCLKRTT